MKTQTLRNQAQALDRQIGEHQQQADAHRRALLARWRASTGILAPVAGAVTGTALALVPLRVLARFAWRSSSVGWFAIRNLI
jgi:hypothetical protein